MTLFNKENTEYYTQEERDSLNAEWDSIVEAGGLSKGSDEYEIAAKAFYNEIRRAGWRRALMNTMRRSRAA